MDKQEALAKIRSQGYSPTPEEVKILDVLLTKGKMSETDLEKVSGGISPMFKKALIGAGILAAVATAAVAGPKIIRSFKKPEAGLKGPAVESLVATPADIPTATVVGMPDVGQGKATVPPWHRGTFYPPSPPSSS